MPYWIAPVAGAAAAAGTTGYLVGTFGGAALAAVAFTAINPDDR